MATDENADEATFVDTIIQEIIDPQPDPEQVLQAQREREDALANGENPDDASFCGAFVAMIDPEPDEDVISSVAQQEAAGHGALVKDRLAKVTQRQSERSFLRPQSPSQETPEIDYDVYRRNGQSTRRKKRFSLRRLFSRKKKSKIDQ